MATILPPTKTESTLRSIGYFFLGSAGLWILINPPTTIQGHLGWLTYVWGVCTLTAYVASLASYKKRYRVEYMALPLTLTGMLIYGYTVWSIVPEVTTRGPQALVISAMFVVLAVRFLTLHRLVVSWKGKPWIGSLP